MREVFLNVKYCGLLIPAKTGVKYLADSPRGPATFDECEGFYFPADVWTANQNLELFPYELSKFECSLIRDAKEKHGEFLSIANFRLESSSHPLLQQLTVDENMVEKSNLHWLYCKTVQAVQLYGLVSEQSVIVVTPLYDFHKHGLSW